MLAIFILTNITANIIANRAGLAMVVVFVEIGMATVPNVKLIGHGPTGIAIAGALIFIIMAKIVTLVIVDVLVVQVQYVIVVEQLIH